MARKGHRGILLKSVALLVTLFLLLVAVPVVAADGDVADSTVTLDVTVEDSSWKVNAVSIKNLGIPIPGTEEVLSVGALTVENVSKDALSKLSEKYMGTEIALPEVPSDMAAFLEESGIHTLVIRKTTHSNYQQVNLYMDDTLLMSARASGNLLETLSEEMDLDELGEMIWDKAFSMREVTIILRTEKGASVPVSFEDEATPLSKDPTNYVSLGATLDTHLQDTEIVSLAGFTAEELNTVLAEMSPGAEEYTTPRLPILDTIIFEQLEIENMIVTAGRNGLEVSIGGQRWVKLLWDEEGRNMIYEQIPAVETFIGQDLPVNAEELSIMERVLKNSELDLNIYVSDSDEPEESLPTIHVGSGVVLEIDDDGNLSLGDQALFNTGMESEQWESTLPLKLTFDGAGGAVKTAVLGNVPMPVLFFEPGSLPPLLSMYVNDNIPWEKAGKVLQNITFSLVLTPEDVLPAGYDTSYPIASVTAPKGLSSVLSASKEGDFSFGGTRISGIAEAISPGIKEVVALNVAAYGQFEEAELAVGPNAVTLSVDEAPPVGIRWDAELRGNVLELVPLPDLPFGLERVLPSWDRQVIEFLLSREHRVQVFVVEEIEESPAEKWLPYLLE